LRVLASRGAERVVVARRAREAVRIGKCILVVGVAA